MMWIIYIALMGAINTWRGRGYVPNSRYYAMALWGLLTGAVVHYLGIFDWQSSALVTLIVVAGSYVWLEQPWGQGFAAYTGVWEPRPNTVHWIENICLKLYPYPGAGLPDPKAYARGTLFMALRGLYIIPLFLGLAVFLGSPFVALLGLVGLMQGPSYGIMRWVTPCSHGHWDCQAAPAEFLTMASFATAIVVAFL